VRLAVGEAAHLVVGLSVRDCGRDQVCERGEALLRARRKDLLPLRGDEHDAPDATLDYDRRCDRRAPAVATGDLRGLARRILVSVDPGRLPRLRHDCQDVVAADGRASADRYASSRRAPASDRGRCAVAVVAADNRDVGVKKLSDL